MVSILPRTKLVGWDLKVTGLHSAITEPHANHLRAVYGSNILAVYSPSQQQLRRGSGALWSDWTPPAQEDDSLDRQKGPSLIIWDSFTEGFYTPTNENK